ncbi:MAG: methyltransferase domain-containing protein [Candidatus Solibacter usitatus]|nr:methyltransferase domain-containing protein [Candidatus Solibacter usitatus]
MPDPTRIIGMANAFFDSCLLFAACDLGVFGRLDAMGGADSDALAAALELDPRAARILLDACVSTGLLEKEGSRYRNAPESSAFLVPGRPGDLSGVLRYNRDVYAAWGRVASFAKSGAPVESPQLHLGDDPHRTRTFVMSMHYKALSMARASMSLLDIAGRRQLLDVGGGPGTFSVLIAQANPEIVCTVLDLPPVAAIASELIAQQGASARVKTLPGDYHTTSFPPGNDVVNLFGMLHQESPESIQDLLRRSYQSMRPGGVVQVMDMMTDSTHTAPKFSAIFALTMGLTTQEGWVFSDTELKTWMEEAGFTDFRVAPLPAPLPHWLASARKPG